jgi:triphosphoribosyl-dephospho-CoA synthase
MTIARRMAVAVYSDVARTPGERLSERIATQAYRALLRELATWPKPGLVSHVDNGSHGDMNASMLRTSAAVLRPYFAELAMAGYKQAGMNGLRAIGLRAEAAMLSATGGVNTHRGAIFGLGLLCAAAGSVAGVTADGAVVAHAHLGAIVARRWGNDIRRGPIPLFSHGSAVLRQYGARGARGEAEEGFPSVYEIGLPALHLGRMLAPDAAVAPQVQACFALIAAVRDSNLLHRGGVQGASYAAQAAAHFLSQGGVGALDWHHRAAAVHASFVARNLSPGGCADLLAMTLFVDALESGVAIP